MPEEPNMPEKQPPNDAAELNASGAANSTPDDVAPADAVPDSGPVGMDDIQALMEAAENGAENSTSPTSVDDAAEEPVAQDEAAAPTGMKDETAAFAALDQAAEDLDAAAATPVSATTPDTTPFQPPDFGTNEPATHTAQLDLLDDVELDVKIELGRTEMYIEEVLGLGTGSVVALDKAAGDPVDVFVNERLVARGEVVVLNDNFCVRINDILSPVPELEE